MRRRNGPIGFTPRAITLLIAGILTLLAGLLTRAHELYLVGGFAVALPLLAAVLAHSSRTRLEVTRHVAPTSLRAGDRAEVTLILTNHSRHPARSLLLQDDLPASLGEPARFVLAQLGPTQSHQVSYRLSPLRRGWHEIGPLRLHQIDTFGLIDRDVSTSATGSVLVTPAVESLTKADDSLGSVHGGSASHDRGRSSESDGLAVRPYREGDDARRVHWRLSARAGALIVRHDERSAPNEVGIAMDLRAAAYPDLSPTDRQGAPDPNPSFEWMIHALASIATHLVAPHQQVNLYGDPTHPRGLCCTSPTEVLEYLALLCPHRSLTADDLAQNMARATHHPASFVILGSVDGPLVSALGADANTHTGPRHAITLNADAVRRSVGRSPVTTDLAERLDQLSALGWRVTQAEPNESIGVLWRQLWQPQAQAGWREVGVR